MREIVVISGKGGTGKTSILASFAVLAEKAVLADCDVDAADLHLVLKPQINEIHNFISGNEAVIDMNRCNSCGACLNLCRFDAIREIPREDGDNIFRVDPVACEGCGVCVSFCPLEAVDFPERHCGVWMVSDTRAGPMVHARLNIAAENSGKLASTVRQEARRVAREKDIDMILVDGPPGTGCPVIASITGASEVLIVTEPTMSGEHDLRRTLELAAHFGIPASVCINKWDISPEMTGKIEKLARSSGAKVLGRIRYDQNITKAQMDAKAVVESDASGAEDIKHVWKNLISNNHLKQENSDEIRRSSI
jgi:MinD superfamily P-loop ATPase